MVLRVIEGSRAVAEAVRLAKARVIAAYPITPQTHIVEYLAEMIANGELDAEMIRVESEHSALSAVVGAAATGVRTFTATNSQGLMLMSEILWIASGMRLPIVMCVVNRALSAPINIWCDHSDSYAVRDSGWIQFYVKNPQEALDTVLQAYRVAESHDVLLPVMVCMDGFVLSHVYEPVDIPDQKTVDKFLPPYDYPYKLDPEHPRTLGPVGGPAHYMFFKRAQEEALERAIEVIEHVNSEFYDDFGRKYGDGLIEVVNRDAATALVCLGSTAETVEYMIEEEGFDVCLVRIRCAVPFPREKIKMILENKDRIIVLERSPPFGKRGYITAQIESTLSRKVFCAVCGLGGKDIKREDIRRAVKEYKEGETAWIL